MQGGAIDNAVYLAEIFVALSGLETRYMHATQRVTIEVTPCKRET